jgi:ubiquinone/menaquinone biosynthesis C-methylase UbiE
MNASPTDFHGNIERFSGFADLYDKYRPAPPAVLASVLLQLAQAAVADRVVDLGSGTGLSTRYWADKAREVIGIEPVADMRRQAEARTQVRNVSYREGFSHNTGLPDRCAQIVTCAQALHWMEPEATFAEAARILAVGGVFAAYDYEWPPTTGAWEAEAAYTECMQRVREYEKTVKSKPLLKHWNKAQHLTRLQASGRFRYTKEMVVHHVDQGDADRFIGLVLSQGGVMTLLKDGVSEAQLGIDRFRAVATRILGEQPQTWYWGLRVRLGVV